MRDCLKNYHRKKNMEVWKATDFEALGDSADITANAIGVRSLLKNLLTKKDGHLSDWYEEGPVKPDDDDDIKNLDFSKKYEDLLVKKGGRLIYRSINNRGDNTIYLWYDGIVGLNISGSYVSIQVYSYNESFARELKDYFATQWAPPERTGHIYAIVKQAFGLGLSSIGDAGIPLVKGNYTPKVMEDYKFAIRDLQSETPSGRIIIMKGPPGTGKTHLIRAMLLEVPDAMFVLVSPDMVSSLAGPELLPLLISHRGATTGPIILILEDADKCLVSRNEESENMNSIQSLLNLGDGILGSLLDLRIIATTNADEFKMDPAILRPGRLSKMLDVTLLDFKTAQSVFLRLLPNAKANTFGLLKSDTPIIPEKLAKDNPHNTLQISLAEVYYLARKAGWVPALRNMEDEEEEEEDPLWDE